MTPLVHVLLVGAALLLLPGIVSGQVSTLVDDEQIETLVEQRLQDKHITGVDVSVDRQVVTLRGTVPSLWAKTTALERARETRYVHSVINELAIIRAESDAVIAQDVADHIRRYVFFTIFDDAEAEVIDGVVTLKGKVTMPYKADAFADLASRVRGVQDVKNLVTTLPVSTFDDQLRYTIARNIYGDPLFWNLAIQFNPPLHIIVERGHVTLTGAVLSEVERRMAESIARSTFGVFSVENRLRIEED
jgi:osmotically-inducible protein OsmY